MKTKSTALTLAFCLLAPAACFAADPQMGTWKLNEAKSKIAPGRGKNTMVVYKEATVGQVKITTDGVDANGNPMHSEWTGKFDGKEYPIARSAPDADMRSYKKADDRTLDFTATKGGRVTVNGRVVVAADGKSSTVTTTGTTGATAPTGRAWQRGDFVEREKGRKFKSIAVYDKQ